MRIKNGVKRVGVFLLMFLLVGTNMPIDGAIADSSENDFVYIAGRIFAGGDGSANDPFLIENVDQLNEVRNHLDGHFKLVNDLNLDVAPWNEGEGWEPIGSQGNHFTGSFNGANHAITGLTINRVGGNYQGLFGYVGTVGVIENTLLEGVRIDTKSDSSFIGSLAGASGGRIENSSVKGNEIKGYRYVGGLVGWNTGTIINSFASIDVMGVGTSYNAAYIGGLVGGNDSPSSGGIVSINNAYSTGKVIGQSDVGGLVGSNTSQHSGGSNEITNSYATGEVTGVNSVGGLVGYNRAAYGRTTITNSYATGKVVADNTRVGGLVGYSLFDSDEGALIKYINSYWDFDTTGQLDSGGGEGKTTAEMMQRDTFVDWDFDTNWYQYENQTLPFHQWQNPLNLWHAELEYSTLPIGGETNIEVTATHQIGPIYNATAAATYSVSNNDIVMIDKGKVTAVKGGKVEIMVSLSGDVKTLHLDIIPDAPVINETSQTVNADIVTFEVTGKTQAEAAVQITGGSAVVNGTADAYGDFTVSVPLNKNTVNHLKVIAMIDGLESNAVELSISYKELSSTAKLGMIYLDATELENFDSAKLKYEVHVPHTKEHVTVTADVYDSEAGFRVNGELAPYLINLVEGMNKIEIVVTAENGEDFGIYTVYVNREAKESPPNRDDDNNGDNSSSTPSTTKAISTNGYLKLLAGQAGEVSLGDAISISIPAGATDKEMTLNIEEVLDMEGLLTNGEVLVSPIFELLKSLADDFLKPVTITIVYDPNLLVKGQTAAIFYYDEITKQWLAVTELENIAEAAGIPAKVDGNRIAVEVDHFTKLAVLIIDDETGLLVTSLETPGEAPVEIQFSDITGHWAEDSIKQAIVRGIVTGYPDGTFKPNKEVTRAEFTVMVMNALDTDYTGITEDAGLTFTDAGAIGTWAQQAVQQAVQSGIIIGYEDDSFRPNAVIRRSKMAVIIARALELPTDANVAISFADNDDIPAWAKGDVAALHKLGIIEGQGDNRYAPHAELTRAEAITVLLSMLTYLGE